MKTKYTLQQRLLAATPPFFKKLQAFGLGLAGLGTSLTQINGIPANVTTALISIGSTTAIISQFAVNQFSNNDDNK